MNTISKIVRRSQSSFFWLMQLLPKAQRVGAYTIFAFNHHIEKEIVKSNLNKEEKLEMLNVWRQEVNNIFDYKVPQTDIGRKIYKNCMRFNIEKKLFVKVIEGYKKSLFSDFFNPNLKEYKEYCNDVYGARIEMGLKIFSQEDTIIANLMANFIHPVVALENMKEDCQMGFLYLPKEFLENAQISITTPQDVLINPKLADARNQFLKFAYQNLKELEDYYKKADQKNIKIIKGFINIYKKYLEIMQTRGMEVIIPKPFISNFSKMKIILKNMLGK